MGDIKYKYPKMFDYEYYRGRIVDNIKLMYEYGASAEELQKITDNLEAFMKKTVDDVLAVKTCDVLAENEPNDWASIVEKCKADFDGNKNILNDDFANRLKGAFIGRMAGCTLGAPVEFWSPEKMKEFADRTGDIFPNEDYWIESIMPTEPRYMYSVWDDYTRERMDGVPCDDDITYTILGLLILEDYGIDFTVKDVGDAWVKYLPMACTAEDIALKNLKKNIDAMEVANIDNPFVQWIGADIRSDPWGYVCPGNPALAAKYAYTDAYISHRRNGIFGEMYFSAVIALSFVCDSYKDALVKGLDYVPTNCRFAEDMRWALEVAPQIKNYEDASAAVAEYFGEMSGVHTNINASLVVFGLFIGDGDFSKTIGQVVAMSYDNDCTAATAGSIIGGIIGFDKIPEKWYKRFNNKVVTYINDNHEVAIDDILARFESVAEKIAEK